jgi:CheY-like chemotaxis protein
MDLQMPVMNGFESADEIRKLSNKKKSRTPIVALTGSSITPNENLRRLFDDILTKPVSIEQLQFMVKDILQKRKNH